MDGESFDLSRLEDEQLGQLFQQRRQDFRFLGALNRELNRRDSDGAFELQLEVVQARRAFARAASGIAEHRPRTSGPVRDWLRAFLAARGLPRPDGRALYRYRMTDGEYDRAKETLRHLARQRRLAEPDDRAGALFVAYCAEWFRRESDSTFLRWDDPAPDLFPSVPYASKQQLTTSGLSYWRRDLRMNGATREFLLTVALEGGFPVRILANGARGWLRDYLRSIMRRAIAYQAETRDEILAIAEEERGRMRKSYQHDDFVALCSELVGSLLDLRRRAEAEGSGNIRNSALLDIKHPGWRDDLPIYVPAEDEVLVSELLTGLLDEKMAGLSTEGVEVRRFLVRREDRWVPAVQILADGEIPPAKLPHLSAQGRVRAVPSGELSNHIAGELALLEPPAGDQRRWRVRPFMRTAKLLEDFPFMAPVTATLTSPDGAPCPWIWPRGDALRSNVLVFREDEGSTPEMPLLRLLRSGSASSPAKTLQVLFPDDWMVEPKAENAIAQIESLPGLGRKLARLTGTAYFRGPDSDSVSFRVEPDTEARLQELELEALRPTGFAPADDRVELVASPIVPQVRDGGRPPRPLQPGELFARPPGGKWMPLSGPLSGAGLMELSWRDPEVGIQIERRLAALVPDGARIVGTMKDAQSADLRLEALPGWTAFVDGASCLVERNDGSALSIRFAGRPVYRLPMTLRPPVGQPFEIVVPLMGRDAAIALADGSILRPGAQVDLGTLRGAVAVSPRRTALHLGAKGARSGGLSTAVDGELPLGVLRGAIDETLATLPGQDDLVELEFIGDTRPPIRISRYRHEQFTVIDGRVRWTGLPNLEGRPVARMILAPRHEYLLEAEDSGFWQFPERCKGPCLVYLRDGMDVVLRPAPIMRPGFPHAYSGSLVSALSITDHGVRQIEIESALQRLGRGDCEAGDLNWLLDAVINLNGLPASAFDAIKLLPSCPEALLRLLVNARDSNERSAVWSLQNGLPFLWLELPLSAWGTVLRTDYASVSRALEPIVGTEKAAREALGRLASLRDEIVALEPALGSVFDLLKISAARPSETPALSDLTSRYVANQFHRASEPRNDLAARLASAGIDLPAEIRGKSHEEIAGLFAPVLLAASAQGRLSIERDLAPLVRRTLREEPAYVSGAWPHLLNFYGAD